MRKLIIVVALTLLAVFTFASVASAAVYTRGYYKKNGTYVAPYYRSNPDGYTYNNYNSYGNINPYTGSFGTKRPSYNNYMPSYRNYDYTP